MINIQGIYFFTGYNNGYNGGYNNGYNSGWSSWSNGGYYPSQSQSVSYNNGYNSGKKLCNKLKHIMANILKLLRVGWVISILLNNHYAFKI